jgi:hypothetical protein
MMRRLLETSIIEAFEADHMDDKVKNAQGDFFQLSDLVGVALAKTSWNLSRNTKKRCPTYEMLDIYPLILGATRHKKMTSGRSAKTLL